MVQMSLLSLVNMMVEEELSEIVCSSMAAMKGEVECDSYLMTGCCKKAILLWNIIKCTLSGLHSICLTLTNCYR